MTAVERVKEPSDLVPVPDVPALKFRQRHVAVIDVVENGGDLHRSTPWFRSKDGFILLPGTAPDQAGTTASVIRAGCRDEAPARSRTHGIAGTGPARLRSSGPRYRRRKTEKTSPARSSLPPPGVRCRRRRRTRGCRSPDRRRSLARPTR